MHTEDCSCGNCREPKTPVKQIGGNHYLKDIQPWDVFKAWWPEHFATYCMMTSIKYIMREKGNKVEDLQKAIHYLEAAIDEIKNART